MSLEQATGRVSKTLRLAREKAGPRAQRLLRATRIRLEDGRQGAGRLASAGVRLSRNAAVHGGEMGRALASRGGELGRRAATVSGELGRNALAQSGDLTRNVASRAGRFGQGISRRARTLYKMHWPPAVAAVVLVLMVVVLVCEGAPRSGIASEPTLAAQATATLTATTGATPTKTAKPMTKAQAAQILKNLQIQYTVGSTLDQMTLDEKVGQMIMFETYSTTWDSSMAQTVAGMHAGAIIIYGKNMKTPEQLTQFIADAQAHTQIPMFVTTDEEGGNVDRLGFVHFNTPLPSAQYLGSTGDPAKAYDAGKRAAAELAAYGMNVDLAPVVDVRTVAGQVEGPRLFGSTPQQVDSYAGQFLQALQQNNIIGTLKHWPGIGSTTLDPHKTLPTISKSRAELDSTEFAAFKGLLKDNPGMIMVTHVILSAIDPTLPASLSPKVVQGILRDELGYQGVVITDNLWMKGVSDRYSLGEAAVRAILAGDDLIEGPWTAGTMQVVVSAIKSAINSGRIPMSRVNEAVSRILRLKAQYGILPLRTPKAAGQQKSNNVNFGLAFLPGGDMPRNAVLA